MTSVNCCKYILYMLSKNVQVSFCDHCMGAVSFANNLLSIAELLFVAYTSL